MNTEPRYLGRPIRFPRDSGPLNSLNVDATARLAWLLLRLRLHAEDARLHQRKLFAEALGQIGVNADPSRVSRWESGTNPIPDRVLHGYGQLLGFTAGHLTSIAHNLRSALDPQHDPGLLLISDVPEAQSELDALFAEIRTENHDGHSWTQLAASIMQGTYMYLPEDLWDQLCERLLSETVRSQRAAHIRRLAASNVLIRHLPSQRSMVRSIGGLVTNRAPRFLTPAVTLLREVSNPQTSALLLQMLTTARGQLRRATASTLAAKVSRNDLGTENLATAEAILTKTLAGSLRERGEARFPTDMTDLLAAMPPSTQDRILRELGPSPAVNQLRDHLESGLAVPADKSHRLASMIARRATALANSAQNPIEADQMLVRLIEEALFHVHHERRYQAGLLLGNSPFATALPTALLQTLDTTDRYTVSRCLAIIAFLRPTEDIAGQLLTWVLHHPADWLRCRAMTALVPLGDTLGTPAQNEIAALVERSSDLEIVHTGLNLLGTIGSPTIATLATSEDEGIRTSAAWWRDSGPLISEDPPTSF